MLQVVFMNNQKFVAYIILLFLPIMLASTVLQANVDKELYEIENCEESESVSSENFQENKLSIDALELSDYAVGYYSFIGHIIINISLSYFKIQAFLSAPVLSLISPPPQLVK